MRRSQNPSRQQRKFRHSHTSLLSRLAESRAFQPRLRALALIWLILLAVAILRLVILQIFLHPYYFAQAQAYHVRQRTVVAARGTIFDRHGEVLALSVPRKSIFADPELFPGNPYAPLPEPPRGLLNLLRKKPIDTAALLEKEKKAIADSNEKLPQLASLLGLNLQFLKEQLNAPGRFFWLKRSVPDELAEKISGLRLRWVNQQNEESRSYPYRLLAAQTLGFVGAEHRGLAGIEAACDSLLGGQPGKVSVEVDARGNTIQGLGEVRIPPRPGQDVTLTIDLALQEVAEKELAKAIKTYSARSGEVLVMDPNNGEILALASQPAFDPNDFQKASPEHRKNPAVVNVYEPGSTFKIVVACAALEEGAIKPSDIVTTCTGEKAIGSRTIHCAPHGGSRAHGPVNLEKIIEKSCNIGAATLALRLGRERYSHYVKLLGFGQKTGIELAAESRGQVPPPDTWKDIQVANIAFGQGISVTPLQLLRAYCVVANGGYLVRPHLLMSTDPQKDIGERVISDHTAQQMRQMFYQVVEGGTGKAAQVPGYMIAGKTGTAQKPIPGLGYKSNKYIGSFIGFVPADRPRIAILVLLDEPAAGHLGGVVAAPVFREVARQALLQMKIPPSAASVAQPRKDNKS